MKKTKDFAKLLLLTYALASMPNSAMAGPAEDACQGSEGTPHFKQCVLSFNYDDMCNRNPDCELLHSYFGPGEGYSVYKYLGKDNYTTSLIPTSSGGMTLRSENLKDDEGRPNFSKHENAIIAAKKAEGAQESEEVVQENYSCKYNTDELSFTEKECGELDAEYVSFKKKITEECNNEDIFDKGTCTVGSSGIDITVKVGGKTATSAANPYKSDQNFGLKPEISFNNSGLADHNISHLCTEQDDVVYLDKGVCKSYSDNKDQNGTIVAGSAVKSDIFNKYYIDGGMSADSLDSDKLKGPTFGRTEEFKMCQRYVKLAKGREAMDGDPSLTTWQALVKQRHNPKRWNNIYRKVVGYLYKKDVANAEGYSGYEAGSSKACFSDVDCKKMILEGQDYKRDQNIVAADKVAALEAQADSDSKSLAARNTKVLNSVIRTAMERVSRCDVFLQVTAENFLGSKEDIIANNKAEKDSSFDGRITCVRNSIETIDFDDCVALKNTHSTFVIGGEVNKTREVIVANEEAHEAQMKAMQMTQDGASGDIATQSLEMQKGQIETQKKLVNQRLWLNGIKSGMMLSMAKGLPNEETLLKTCKGKTTKVYVNPTLKTRLSKEGFENASDEEIAAMQAQVKGINDDAIDKLETTNADKEEKKQAAHESISKMSGGDLLNEYKKSDVLTEEDEYRQYSAYKELAGLSKKELVGEDAEVYNEELFSSVCESAFNSTSDSEFVHDFLANQKQEDAGTLVAMKAGIDALGNFAQKKALEQRVEMINAIIEKVKNKETIGALPQFDGNMEAFVKYCEANPNAADCQGLGTGMVSTIFSPGMSFGGDGFGANDVSVIGDSGDNANAISVDSGSDDEKNADPTKVNRALASVNKSTGLLNKGMGPAGLKSGDGSGGGQGSANSASASAGGLPGGNGAGGKGQARNSSKRYRSKIGYSGGGRGVSFARRGSRKGNSRGSKGNPFANMFKKGKGGKVLNFRNTASSGIGGKSGSLFDRISKQYDKMEASKRLLEYKVK